MRILVLSNTAWDNQNSFGGSFSNIFSGIQGLQIANIYCRYGNPNNTVASEYFQITEKSLLRNLKSSSYPSGKRVLVDEAGMQLNAHEQATFDTARKKRWKIFFWLRDFIWLVGRWRSPQLQAFIDDFKPDLIFQPVYYSNYLLRIAQYLKAYTGVPMVGYISDDCYTLRQFNLSPLYWLDRLHKRKKVKKVIRQCELLYVISEIQKQDYEKAFGVPCKILTKSADFSGEPPVKTQYNSPLQLVFTGNIGTNRWKSLAIIAEALEQINQNGVRAQLRIYTATPLTAKMEKALKKGDSSFIMGSVPANEVPKIQEAADILVHVEALDLKNRLAVRQSFSTKLVDYFKAARPILAVGPREVASIDHLIRNDCALNGETVEEVRSALESVLENRGKLDELSKKAYACGKRNHNAELMHHMLQTDLETIARRVEFEDFADKRSQ